MKPKKKRENPVDKGQTQVKTGIACKYCDKVCLNEETLSIHINNKHADRQPMFQCAFCGLRLNKLNKCREQFDNARVRLQWCPTVVALGMP